MLLICMCWEVRAKEVTKQEQALAEREQQLEVWRGRAG